MPEIVLVDHYEVVRRGLKAVLQEQEQFSVVADTGNSDCVPEMLRVFKPDVLITDLTLPGLIGGLGTVRYVVRHSPDTRIIIFSACVQQYHVIEAFRNGASAYVLKDAPVSDVVHAVYETMAGHRFLSPPFSDRLIECSTDILPYSIPDHYETLTNREREVLPLVAEGCTNIEIGNVLFISPRTAEIHRANIMRKLRLRSQADLIRYALRHGILSLEPAFSGNESMAGK